MKAKCHHNRPLKCAFPSSGNLGIGHNRYSTSGEKDDLQLAQPFVVHTSYGTLSVAHNGELVNSKKLRKKVLESGECTFGVAFGEK